MAATVLQNLNAELDEVRQRIEERVKKVRPAQMTGPDLPYTSPAKKVLELAMQEARDLHHSYVGTEHLLLGLLAEGKGIAAQVLGTFGITLESARAETLRILGSEMSAHPAAEPPPDEKPARIGLTLHYSNGAVVKKSFTNVADAASFLSAQ